MSVVKGQGSEVYPFFQYVKISSYVTKCSQRYKKQVTKNPAEGVLIVGGEISNGLKDIQNNTQLRRKKAREAFLREMRYDMGATRFKH